MKGTAFLLFCTLALGTAKPKDQIELNAEGCPVDPEISKFLPHENCNQFYQCVGGIPIALSCPGDLLFNTDIDICDWPLNVDCDDRVIPEERPETDSSDEEEKPGGHGHSDPSLAPEICAVADSDGVLVAHENCTEFYVCEGRRPVALQCPDNLLYNPDNEQCDWPQNVDCGERVIPETHEDSQVIFVQESSIASYATVSCSQANSEGTLVAHENCNRFYKCNGGKPVALTCPAGLLYNIAAKYCDWPSNVKCGDRTIAQAPEDTEDCNESNGNSGDGTTTPENGHSDPSQAPAICAAEGSDGVLVAHENCNRFYKCSEGKQVALDCPSGLVYNIAAKYCDWPSNVECGDRTIAQAPEDTEDCNESNGNGGDGASTPENGHSDPSQAPAICAAEGSDGVLVAHENCNRFYKCSEGKQVALDCPSGLVYNVAAKYCDWPSNVECGDRTIAQAPEDSEDGNESNGSGGDGTWTPENGHCDPSQAPAICAAEGSTGVLVAHENCSQFYKCDGGVPKPHDCPSSLLYQPKLEICDWPQNVNCAGRN